MKGGKGGQEGDFNLCLWHMWHLIGQTKRAAGIYLGQWASGRSWWGGENWGAWKASNAIHFRFQAGDTSCAFETERLATETDWPLLGFALRVARGALLGSSVAGRGRRNTGNTELYMYIGIYMGADVGRRRMRMGCAEHSRQCEVFGQVAESVVSVS